MDENKFLLDNCHNCFRLDDEYKPEKEVLKKIELGNFENTKQQGDLLEDLVKNIFSRIILISSLSVTSNDTALGQIDISLMTIDETIYEIWGMIGDSPACAIGECKNYKTDKVGRPEIEKMCWRASKGQALSFFIAPSFKQPAIKEISDFNLYKNNILKKSQGVYIVPITLKMLEIIIDNNLNFCYFIRWAIQASKKMIIANYL